MNAEVKAQWIAALRSGEYKQGKTRLTTVAKDGEQKDCCLGVLCKVVGIRGVKLDLDTIQYEGSRTALPTRLVEELELPDESVRLPVRDENDGAVSLAGLNDAGATFDQIADVIKYFL